jgi:hypothetical protein
MLDKKMKYCLSLLAKMLATGTDDRQTNSYLPWPPSYYQHLAKESKEGDFKL